MSSKSTSGGQYGSAAAAVSAVAVDDYWPVVHLFKQFSATGATAAVAVPNGVSSAQVLLATTGSPTSATVVAQGSNDGGTTWTTMPAGNQPLGAVRYTQVRLNCTALAGGTSPTITASGIFSP